MKDLLNLIKKAKGEELPELVLKSANIVSVFTGEIIKADLAIDQGIIVGIGSYEGQEEVDLEGMYLAPGFIDSHVHIESSMSTPLEFSKAILARGVTTIIADPHEIANVKGIEGIEYIINESKKTPLDVFTMLPSCVPATGFENSGAILEAEDLEPLMDREGVLGLGEMMNYPGLLNMDQGVMKKLVLARGRMVDGHGPIISGKDLNAYIVSGVKTEHEASTKEEVLERIRLGMYILIREGSASRDLKNIIGLVNKDNISSFLFCTDDKHPEDLLKDGSIDYNIRLAIESGLDPIDAIKIATINSARAYSLKDRGGLGPGYKADIVVFDNFEDFNIKRVYKDGKLVAKEGRALFKGTSSLDPSMTRTVNIKEVKKQDLQIPINHKKARVIRVREDSLITDLVEREVNTENGFFKYGKDGILKLVVVERHFARGNVGLGLLENFGLKNAAIGSTIGHDSHNLIVAGDNDEDILVAIEEIEKMGGGLVIVSGSKPVASLSLEIGGLMTGLGIYEVNEKLKSMIGLARQTYGVKDGVDPFMTLAFMALPVIPELKLTDMGLFHVGDFKFVDVSL